jgi:dimethylhistidine N-methyltransferase
MFLQDVLNGLYAAVKAIPCKYFYDRRGSQLFDQICQLDEYYLTRAELAIMRESAAEMARQIGPGAMLVEYGSGSSIKTRYLLDALLQPVAYVPVDVSGEHLELTASELAMDYPHIEVLPICADFSESFELPSPKQSFSHTAVYFPGSTIGNFLPERAVDILRHIAISCGMGGGLLIGIDLKKDSQKIEAAYNDALGVTTQFTLNLLRRINEELEGDFRLDQFQHRAVYNSELSRVEIDLVSRRPQRVTVAGHEFNFRRGESIRTEYSYKYTFEEFALLAASAGLMLHHKWIDEDKNFAVLHLVVEQPVDADTSLNGS